MAKFIGFILICVWTGMSFLIGYLLGDRNNQLPLTPLIVEKRCDVPQQTFEYVYVHVEPSACTLEKDYAEDETYEDEMYEDEMYEDDDSYDQDPLEIEQIIFTSPGKLSTQLLLGYHNTGSFEAKLNIPINQRFGLYVGFDTKNQYSAGASINLF